MKKTQKTEKNIIFLCSCLNSIKIDNSKLLNTNDSQIVTARELCGAESNFLHKIDKNKNVIIACTQEKKFFKEKLQNDIDKKLKFINIRELAGWTNKDQYLTPKILSMLYSKINTKDFYPHYIDMHSQGRITIIGEEDNAYETAIKLADRLDVTLILIKNPNIILTEERNFNIYKGSSINIKGYFGNFQISISEKKVLNPSSRENLQFLDTDGDEILADIVIDMSNAGPNISNYKKLKGYFYVEPTNILKLYSIMFDVTGLIGGFQKPKYIDFNKDLCAHSRNKQIGCSKCLDVCPTSAIKSIDHNISINSYICAGCGNCSASCPTEAITYQHPPTEVSYMQIRNLLTTYLSLRGLDPSILFYTKETGFNVISAIARLDNGLDSSILPFELDGLGQISAELLWMCYSLGAYNINILIGKKDEDISTSLNQEIVIAETLLKYLDYKFSITLIEDSDPFLVAKTLNDSLSLKTTKKNANFLPIGGKRKAGNMAITYLKENSKKKINIIPLPKKSPYGAVNVSKSKCTLCLACIGVCPSGALADDKDSPILSFKESLCIQCSLCVNTCPENALELIPQLNFEPEAKNFKIINQEEPFKCISCNKPFGVKSSINKTIVKLKEHSMFVNNTEALNRLKMCDNCRVVDQFNSDSFKDKNTRKKPRTTDDYKK